MAETNNLIAGETGNWEIVLGLEVHAQVASTAKLFSGAATESSGAPQAVGEAALAADLITA